MSHMGKSKNAGIGWETWQILLSAVSFLVGWLFSPAVKSKSSINVLNKPQYCFMLVYFAVRLCYNIMQGTEYFVTL
jgi:hypothetical protein